MIDEGGLPAVLYHIPARCGIGHEDGVRGMDEGVIGPPARGARTGRSRTEKVSDADTRCARNHG